MTSTGTARMVPNPPLAAHWEAATLDAVHAAQLDRHYAVNVRAPVLLCAEFAHQASSHRFGRIIQLTSGQGHSPMPGEIADVATVRSCRRRLSYPA